VREARVAFTAPGWTLPGLDLEIGRAISRLRQWSWAGPYDYESARPLADQNPGGAPQWRPIATAPDGSVDLAAQVSSPDGKLAYAVTFLHSDSDQGQGMKLYLQADDGVEVFVDGISVGVRDGRHSLDESPLEILTALPAGDHELRLKISNVSGAWGFRAGIETGAPVSVSPPQHLRAAAARARAG
jgi:hypothetical protein